MKYYFITGASSGIGLALVEQLVEMPHTKVFGISRSSHITHPNYMAITLDLSDTMMVSHMEFQPLDNAEQIVLINNAGQIGDIKPVGKVDNTATDALFKVNVTSPAILTNNFLKTYQNQNCEKVILNVSSGAGKKPIDGWAAYCASKAAIDLFSQTVFDEQENQEYPVKVYSIAPGVVDTKMQGEIRDSNTDDFSRHAHFVGLKQNNELTSPQTVAEKYIRIVNNTSQFPDCMFSLRDVD
jgi:benzil reductase ((S)-benzoin forming)